MFAELRTEMQIHWSEALARIDLYATTEEDEELHVWFDSNMASLEALGNQTPVKIMKVMPIVSFVRQGIVLWKERTVTSGRLMIGKLE